MHKRLFHVLMIALTAVLSTGCDAAIGRDYDAEFLVEFKPDAGLAQVTLTIDSSGQSVKRMDFNMEPARYSQIAGDGNIEKSGDRVLWNIPKGGGQFRYLYRIDHQRSSGGYDARITDKWAIVRGDDLFPPVKVVTMGDVDSKVRLKFKLPPGWSNVETPYSLTRDKTAFVVTNPKRSFDRPVGWIIAGDVGTRREYIEGIDLVVAAPRGEDMRRMDVIAISNMVLPKMRSAFIDLPPKILIVGAGDPMWRGGLSGPRSLWLHADRPMISEDSTSTLIHELTHVVTRVRGKPGDDWITEGLAEFYSVELMRRAGILTERRFKIAKAFQKEYGASIRSLRSSDSSGPRTARAVQLLMALDAEIRKKTDGAKSIDDVTQKLIAIGEVSTDDIRDISEKLVGGKVNALDTPLLLPQSTASR